ncbi:MAG: hypothetical protein C3F13_07625 [Anaerolineales bacterium]|nr:hypothetical protein [Anaerolineae bacterium]PWB54153.1 MAG: hypothetical protein C3F13_07625 [Anaerolineales bacterium]
MHLSHQKEEQEPAPAKRSSARIWNILTVLILVTLVCVLSYFVILFLNPNSSLNPFPPGTLNPALLPPTVTVTPRHTLVPTWTPTSMPQAGVETPIPTLVAGPVLRQEVIPTEKPAVMVEPADEYAFELQQGSPSLITASQFHQTASCDWMGVAGQATSLNGEAVRGLFVELGGALTGAESVENLAMTGLAPQYGFGGFEITIANQLIPSEGTLWIQLLDQQNLPLSDRIYFNTYEDCQKNLVIIYFNQVR